MHAREPLRATSPTTDSRSHQRHAHVRSGPAEAQRRLPRRSSSIASRPTIAVVSRGWPALALEALRKAAGKMPSHDQRRPWRQKELERKVTDAFADGLRHPRERRYG
jgi:hypothetical protein